MKIQRLLIVITLANFALLIFTLGRLSPTIGQTAAPVLRGSGLEIVDEHGNVRASIKVHSASIQNNGEPYPEMVLLRLITEKGRPSVKIGASEQTSGVTLAGPSGTKNTYAQLGAKGATSSLTLKDEDGREQIVKP